MDDRYERTNLAVQSSNSSVANAVLISKRFILCTSHLAISNTLNIGCILDFATYLATNVQKQFT